MQQDDQNTFKNLTKPMTKLDPAKPSPSQPNIHANLIQKRNILSEGINYILPSFWYQQLIDLNQQVKSLQNIRLPSFETYVSFLNLCGLENPSQSAFHTKQQFPKDSALFGSDFLDQSHYLTSKTLHFSKINNFINANQIEWSVINPLLWSLIESKFQLSQQNPPNNPAQIQKPLKNKNKSSYLSSHQHIPKIVVFFSKQFILQKGHNNCKQEKVNQNEENFIFLYKNVKYSVPRSAIKDQISNQLRKMTSKPITMTLIADQSIKKCTFYRKTQVRGYFCQNLHFKDLLKSLVQIESLQKTQYSEKFYIYDQYGEKIAQKITTVLSFLKIAEKKRLIICTTQLDQIMNTHSSIKENFALLLKNDFNFPQQNPKETMENQKIAKSLSQMTNFFNKLSRQNNVQFLLKTFIKSPVEKQKQSSSISSGFKPFNKKANEIKILSGTFYRQDEELKQNQNSRQSDQVRYLDSATTNLDTPVVEFQNQSQKVYSQSNYSNLRLKKHSSYNRTQRKKKAQHFLQKKKRNNYILRGNAVNNPQSGNHGNNHGDYKKRIKYPLFQSLYSLQDDPQMLEYLIENMRKVAAESIYCNQDELIQHPYTKNTQIQEDSNFKQSFETTDTKSKFRNPHSKRQIINQSLKDKQVKKLQDSLQRIANEIQRFYQPDLDLQKENEEQKYRQKSMFDKLYSEYEEQMALKKDNQEIKTIVDNSQGPYSQVEKHSMKIKYRGTQKVLEKTTIQNDQIIYMSDGLNPIEDNEETI